MLEIKRKLEAGLPTAGPGAADDDDDVEIDL